MPAQSKSLRFHMSSPRHRFSLGRSGGGEGRCVVFQTLRSKVVVLGGDIGMAEIVGVEIRQRHDDGGRRL